LSVFGDYSAWSFLLNSLKIKAVALAVRLQVSSKNLQERVVIVYALVGAIVLLVAVTMISSLDTSGRRRQ
jgi:uncharacterized membrane protein YeaQ/YmgE (transglycosylase-associated protein family)